MYSYATGLNNGGCLLVVTSRGRRNSWWFEITTETDCSLSEVRTNWVQRNIYLDFKFVSKVRSTVKGTITGLRKSYTLRHFLTYNIRPLLVFTTKTVLCEVQIEEEDGSEIDCVLCEVRTLVEIVKLPAPSIIKHRDIRVWQLSSVNFPALRFVDDDRL
jgi:hypothetical protein